jgi:glycosyltransferase involved in cell wall biosynthesis
MIKKINFLIPNIDDGGIEKNLIILSNFFIEKNYDVKIIYTRISKKIKNKLNPKISLTKSKKIIYLNFFNSRINNSINCFIYCLFIKFEKDSILFSMQDHPFGIFLSLFKKIPCLIRVANHPIGSLKFFNNFFVYKIKLFIKVLFYNFASIIICNSNQSSNFFRKSLFLTKKIYTIYNPIKDIIVKKNSFKRNKYNLLTIGRLENQKNLTGLIVALSILLKKNKKIRLTIVGKGSEKQKLINLSKYLKIKKKIIFKEFSKPDIYYKKEGIFILNSFFEGLPNVLIEAIQYKIPIISTNCFSGPVEILKNGKYGYLVKVDDSIGLANQIDKVILNYPDAIKKTKKAYMSLDRFSIQTQCEKYEKIINTF